MHNPAAMLESFIHRVRGIQSVGASGWRALSRDWRLAAAEIEPLLLPMSARKPGGVIVDVGANVGHWSDACIRLLKPAKLICYEPSPLAASILRDRLSRGSIADVREFAVGDAEGDTQLQMWSQSELNTTKSMYDTGKRLHGLPSHEVPQYVQVRRTTLDAQLETVRKIRILKIDVQGAESEVLAGARGVLQRTECLLLEIMLVQGNYYVGALPGVQLLAQVESQSPLRLSAMTAPAFDSYGRGVWANAVLINHDS